VFSHTGDNSIYFDAKGIFGGGAVSDPASPYRSWYRFYHYPDDYDCWWNIKTLPCVEELDEGYLHYMIDDADSVVAHWLRLGADGFRLDVADELPDAFILRLKQRIRQIKPDALLIGEVWEDASNKRAYDVSRRYFVDGELDSVMNYVWRKAILDYVKDKDDGSALAESLQTITENYPPQVLDCVMNLLGSHDRARVLTVLGDALEGTVEEKAQRRLSETAYKQAVEDLKFAAFLQFTLPGMPSIYYGDEAGMEGCEDPYCRRPFPWGREDRELQNYFRRLGRLRKGSEALRYGRLTEIQGGKGCLRFLRRTERQEAVVVCNRSDAPVLLDAAGDLRFGHGLEVDGEDRRLLPKGCCLLLRNLPEPSCIE
jgi:glycosidase